MAPCLQLRKGCASSWSIPSPLQDMQPLSLLRNFVNPECHFGELTTPSNPKIVTHSGSKNVSMRAPESQRFCDSVIEKRLRMAPKISHPQGPGPARAGPPPLPNALGGPGGPGPPGQSSSWSIHSPLQDMQPLSLLRNFVNPECHFRQLATPSNPKI